MITIIRLRQAFLDTSLHCSMTSNSSKLFFFSIVEVYCLHIFFQCLVNPLKPQYDGGIVVNPQLNSGLKGWSTFGHSLIEKRVSKSGNQYVVAHHRKRPHDSLSQKFHLEEGKIYTFSVIVFLAAWLQVSHGNAEVAAMFKTPAGVKNAGWVIAKHDCWSMLKGGLTVTDSGPAQLYFESKNTLVEIWADSISLQPFTQEQWRSHQDISTEKYRMRKIKIRAIDAQGNPLTKAKVSIKQRKRNFPFGCAMNQNILSNKAFQDWFTSRFKVTTFENEMKWYSTEKSPGKENYSIPDAMLQFAQKHHIAVRGHNVVWDDPKHQQHWVKSLPPSLLSFAVQKRIKSVVQRYKGQVIAWDVNNENLHFSFYESKLGRNASAVFYRKARRLDKKATLFLNEYNTIEEVSDGSTMPDKYLAKIREIRSTGYKGPLAIGLEGHFNVPNLPYMRAAIDKLAKARLPIWLTELDVSSSPNQAMYLEEIIREAYAHPAVKGIVMWASWRPEGCYQMCLTDNQFKNLPTGDVVDKFIAEWSHKGLLGVTDTAGFFDSSLFHGEYEVKISHPNIGNTTLIQLFEVASSASSQQTLHVKCSEEPQRDQYGGGIIENPNFDYGTKGWTAFGKGVLQERTAENGNSFIVMHNRTQPLDSLSQRVQLKKGKLYAFSAWVQISEGRETVAVVFKTSRGELVPGGRVIAKQGCWSLLKGGMVGNISSPVDMLFESKNTAIQIWIDNVSLQPFTKKQWRSHQDKSISKVRKKKLSFQVCHANRTAVGGASVTIKQARSGFPFGCAMTRNILKSDAYQKWFASRFSITTFRNEMKWYSTETEQGHENYTIPDAMVKFAKQNDISVRGHNIFWDNPEFQPQWVKALSAMELKKAAAERINSVVSRYRGKLIAWDVVNENLHFSFFEDKLDKNASEIFYSTAYHLDPRTTMFLNEYNTIEYSGDETASPEKYIEKLEKIKSYPGNAGMLAGIGLQSHFGSGQPNIAYMRVALDILGATGLPIWLTEVDVQKDPNQIQYLEEILREGYSHPAVQGIVIWSGPAIDGCGVMCLTEYNYKNTPTGDLVDKLIKEWKSGNQEITADSEGFFDISLFYGEYIATVTDAETNSSTSIRFDVAKNIPSETVHIRIGV
ncbi:hypothetical protein RJ639_033426 [Escallonia herrerae]|uniref:GH10 domain-containing protein n=1 Tax=Escallonia herrerae TaxID=1293975 RepID=A0AA88WYA7_9ASTE|nr:hypothetical protein RJ639_033426 [Escallonia herrerae]